MHVHEGVDPGVVTRSGEAWARVSSLSPEVLDDALNSMVLTSDYAGDVVNPHIAV